MAARENYLDTEAERICTNFYKMSYLSLMRKAMVRWRQNTLSTAQDELLFVEQHQAAVKLEHGDQMTRITERKHARADRNIK